MVDQEVCHAKAEKTPEFKRESVAMTEMPGATVRQIAADPTTGKGVLGRWRRELRQPGD